MSFQEFKEIMLVFLVFAIAFCGFYFAVGAIAYGVHYASINWPIG